MSLIFMNPLTQAVIAWLLILWFLPRLKSVNKTTSALWAFLILISLSTTFQIPAVAALLDRMLGINGAANWVFTYALSVPAVYAACIGIALVLDDENPPLGNWLYPYTLFTFVALIFFLPAFGDVTSLAEADIIGNWRIFLFRLLAHVYQIIALTVLLRMLPRCGRKTSVLPVRIRYQLLSIAVFLGIFSFALRVPYFTISFFYPEFFSTPLAQGLFGTSKLFGLVRVSWLFFFLPDKVYEWALRPFLLIDKWLAFHRLRRLQTEIIALLSLTVRLHFDDKGWHSLRQVNVRNYDAVIAIMEGKKKLLQTDFTAFARSDRLRYAFLQKVLAPIQDQDDYDARVAAYRQASRAYGRFLRLCGYGWLAKPAPDAGLRAWTDEALAAAAQLVGTLNLDFNQFSVADFVQVLERVKGRKIFLFAIPMPDLFYGAWLSDADHPHEYIFYDSSLPPLHQVHVQLHELGHYLFGHKTKQITEADFLQLATAVQTQSVSTFLQPLLMYKPYHTLEKQQFEAEAEAIATITQAQALASSMAGRLTAVSHNNDIENLLYEMGIK